VGRLAIRAIIVERDTAIRERDDARAEVVRLRAVLAALGKAEP
jgi:hypothetical protein